MNGIPVIIPAYRPPGTLATFVEEVSACNEVAAVVVIDDGSRPDYRDLFNGIASLGKTTVLRHDTNAGKGAALKTAIVHLLVAMPGLAGVVTADADGQHAVADVLRMVTFAGGIGEAMALGVRRFDGTVPLRSRLGNRLTRQVFRLVTGVSLGDTQTGLRYIPKRLLELVTRIAENGYAFEMAVLLAAVRHRWRIDELPIQTIYLDRNSPSHFSPVTDSLRIYAQLVRFVPDSFRLLKWRAQQP
jgi:glycosyltransferase involved in cell wall biosynthesis